MRAVAILAPTRAVGSNWVRRCEQQGDLRSFSRTEMRGTAVFLGIVRPFVIVSRPEQLRGLELMGFEQFGPIGPTLPERAALQVRD